jgi:hypothetical protein
VSGAGRIEVVSGGPEAAGSSGDILIAIAGVPFRGPFDWNWGLVGDAIPDPVTVEVARGTEILTFPVSHGALAEPSTLPRASFFFLTTASVAAMRPALSAHVVTSSSASIRGARGLRLHPGRPSTGSSSS